MGKRKKPKKIIIKANSISKKKKVSECCRCNKDKKIEKLCVRCGNNLAWLDYAFCYDCYLKLYLNDKPIPKNLDISATVYLKKCNEIYAYLREKAPGYPFILIET